MKQITFEETIEPLGLDLGAIIHPKEIGRLPPKRENYPDIDIDMLPICKKINQSDWAFTVYSCSCDIPYIHVVTKEFDLLFNCWERACNKFFPNNMVTIVRLSHVKDIWEFTVCTRSERNDFIILDYFADNILEEQVKLSRG